MKRERSWKEDDEKFSERCQHLIFNKIDLKDDEKDVIKSVLLLNFRAHGWGWGAYEGEGEGWHINFEERINSGGDFNDIYSITNYTDALFRFLYYSLGNQYKSAKRDLFDKLNRNPFNINSYTGDKNIYRKRTMTFLNEFINSGKNSELLNKLVNYKNYENTTKHSLTFASLIASATAFKSLSEGDFDKAYKIFRRMNKILDCNLHSNDEEELSSYGGSKTRRRKSRKKIRRKSPRSRKRTPHHKRHK